jgi:hypothetical protein
MSMLDKALKTLEEIDNGVRLFTVDQLLQLAQLQALLAIGEELVAQRLARPAGADENDDAPLAA